MVSSHLPKTSARTLLTVKTISTIELQMILSRKKMKMTPTTKSRIGNPLI